jgi:hypothetical protein
MPFGYDTDALYSQLVCAVWPCYDIKSGIGREVLASQCSLSFSPGGVIRAKRDLVKLIAGIDHSEMQESMFHVCKPARFFLLYIR